MRAITSLSLLALGLLVGTAPVRAADIIDPIVEVPIATTGWYLRGDVGYVTRSKTSGDYEFWNQGYDKDGNRDLSAIGKDETVHYDEIKLRDGASVGAGAGYRFSDQFRADVTADYFKTDVDGRSDCAYLVEIGYNISPVDSGCRYNDSSEATIWTLMANAYVDIAHFGPITPYIGAGAGFAHVSYDTMNSSTQCGTQPGCNGRPDDQGSHPGYDSWRFAGSLMAGATIDITQQLKLDAGYRYTRISEGDAFGFDDADAATGASGVQGRDHGFDLHTIRAGLRYDFF
ncbi:MULTISPECIES: outer membrane protein [unclassified Aureimonas]|jgi:opacity protein-like surface antigen|uniref:outer membrane protein n=1 Tax=unclassified Aureimonas TaxID=2615206 RepID=UPI0006FF4F84|nr:MULTISPECIES: outer membrane protein [unclassified Aureimonas]KQT55162.1 hypothetical protein ASG62_09930 [Aureimonas sp. Leaf427]KQT70951.1 hypothetical protein ASG54_20315 [Aureimonas sp. Leaf460]